MRIRALLRLAVLGATAAVLTATTVSTCVDHDEAASPSTTVHAPLVAGGCYVQVGSRCRSWSRRGGMA